MMTALPPSTSSSAYRLKDFFLARQPILNRDKSLAAYELLFRGAAAGPAKVTDDLFATASVITHTSQLGLEYIIGDSWAFVNVDAAALLHDFIRFLPREAVVLEILETVEATDQIVSRVAQLCRAGYTFALDDVTTDSRDVQKLLPLVDVVKIDITDMPQSELIRLCTKFKAVNKKLLAEKVETLEQFQQCLQLGFDYFQGYYLAKPVVLTSQKPALPLDATMRLLIQKVIPWCMLSPSASIDDIERSIQLEPALKSMLLRLAGAPGGVRQALLTLGRQQLERWLTVLLYAEES